MSSGCPCQTDTDATAPKPRPVQNRPGLPALSCRIGTHGSFMAAMRARLPGYVPADAPAGSTPALAGLSTRQSSDPAIAMLDAWSVVGDIVSFYQERLANEGYLRTATEAFSVQALAAGAGYRLQPGVAASVFLAYTVQAGADESVPIPAGCRVQSVPESGALPQTFETAEPLLARTEWNQLPLRRTLAQRPAPDAQALYFKGVATQLKPNDRLLLVSGGQPVAGPLLRVATVEPQFAENRTRVTLQTPAAAAAPEAAAAAAPEAAAAAAPEAAAATAAAAPATAPEAAATPRRLLQHLVAAPARTQAAPAAQRPGRAAGPAALPDADFKAWADFHPARRAQLYAALAGAAPATAPEVEVHAFRVRAAPFGSTAALEPVFDDKGRLVDQREWTLARPTQASRTTEPFTITVSSVEGNDNDDALCVSVQIGSFPAVLGDNRLNPEQIVIVLEEANEKVTVTIAQDGGDDPDALHIVFANRGIDIRLNNVHKEGETDIQISATGCSPVSLGLARLSFFKRYLKALDKPMGSRLLELLRMNLDSPILEVKGESTARAVATEPTEVNDEVSLDAVYDSVIPGSWVAVERASSAELQVTRVLDAAPRSRADYGMSGRTTRLRLDRPWLDVAASVHDFGHAIRSTTLLAASERLELADAPDSAEVQGESLDLAGVQGGLEPGRWLIVEGERSDIDGTSGVRDAELVQLAGSEHRALSGAAGETLSTTLKLTAPLAHRYVAGSVRVHGNVVRATHGESQHEVLGSGDGQRASARFALHQGPLTYLSADTPNGRRSTLEVRVNDITWHEADSFNGAGPDERCYVTRRGDDGKTLVSFGNGLQGARLPSGNDNVQALYRNGLGSAGNVAAGKLSQAVSRPLGVVSVQNPQAASGGADAETPAQARRNAPRALMALDRLVSVTDHADFARCFAGVGKADAARLPLGRRATVVVSVTGSDEAPLEPDDDVCVNLLRAMRRFGDPQQPVSVRPAEVLLLRLAAQLRLAPDYHWDSVAAAVRAALLQAFGFDSAELAADVALSRVISCIQGVAGVAGVDVDAFDAVPLAALLDSSASSASAAQALAQRVVARPARRAVDERGASHALPAQIAFLSAHTPACLALQEATP
ncbi:Putative baseplate assembly protein [Rubrivivax sp. A210]|uniref:putative baseplate assembly protein n=1 Tax=Rubrivivax sp. A210 TaxID=2772301 RepID=UPI00191B7365|nr:putative baseplate assembly protein [Rubrivivax sp. A210]CAD5367087.1 Putative baseplate assembly protein [Rubrivivax sp. A210]